MDETTQKSIQKALGETIKKRRIELGISQAELGLQSNLNRSYIVNIEKGKCNVSLEIMFLLAKGLGFKAKDLFPKTQLKTEESVAKKKSISEVDLEAILLEFGCLLKEKRLSKNISQEELALNSGLHRTYISQVESGKYNISLENIIVFADTLQCAIADLIPSLRIKFTKDFQEEGVKVNPKEKRAFLIAFGGIIKKKRLKLELSQENLGLKTGLHRNSMNNIEQGQQNISLENIYMLAKALKCQPRELIPKVLEDSIE